MAQFYPLTGPAESTSGPTPRYVGDLWFCTVAGSGFSANALYEHNGTSWQLVSAPGNFGSYKELGSAIATSSQTVTSTSTPGTDLTSLTVTCTPDGVHPVYVDFSLGQMFTSTTASCFIVVQKDGVVVAEYAWDGITASINYAPSGRYRDPAPTKASHIYKLSAYSGSAQTITFNFTSVRIGLLTVTQVQS